MIKLFSVAVFLFFCNGSTAQQKNIVSLLNKNTVRQPLYSTAHAAIEQSSFIYCDFGKAALHFKDSIINFDTVQVTAIDLVFTDFPSDNDLIKLNTERIVNLFKKYPSLTKNKTIAWKVIRQTAGAEKDSALQLFHGFVIYYRPLQTPATIKTDLIKLKEMLAPKDSLRKRRNGFVTGDTTELRKQYEIEEYTTVLKLPVTEALQYLGINEREKVIYKKYDSLFVYLKPGTDSAYKQTLKPPVDSTVLKVLDRMPWKNMLVVADVTASMYPYSGQLLYWLKLHEDERKINQFVFFNDGDDKDDEQKIAGNTGGVYTTASSVFEVVEQLIFKAMSNGNGGGIPENNIEAIIKGMAACNNCDAVVMIADNASGVSDMLLLKNLNKPVHIIVCGVHEAVNVDYLNIARSTKGSVHLATEDVLQLGNINEGEKVTINGRNYVVVNNLIVAE